MFNLMRKCFYIRVSTKCQADLRLFIQCHSFGVPHTYLNIGFSEITGLFDGVFIRIFLSHLTKMAATLYMVKQNMFY